MSDFAVIFICISSIVIAYFVFNIIKSGRTANMKANVKDGTIPFETLRKYVFHEKLKDVPKILETPYVNGLPPYKEEIAELLK